VGDLLYYASWNPDTTEDQTVAAVVHEITGIGAILYVYNSAVLQVNQQLIVLGRPTANNGIHFNGIDSHGDYIENLVNISSFRQVFENFYFSLEGYEVLPYNTYKPLTSTTVNKLGNLFNIVDSSLGVAGTDQIGLYSTNSYLVLNGVTINNVPIVATHTDKFLMLTAGGKLNQVDITAILDGAGQIQSDWAQTNTAAVDFIKNKPTNLVFTSRAINTVGSGITGGGDLSADRNIALDFTFLNNTYQAKEDQRLSTGNSVRFAGAEITTTGIDEAGLIWYANQDFAKIYFQSTGDDNYDSNQVFLMGDNGLLSGTQEGWLFIKDVSTDIGGRIEVLRMNLTQLKYRNQDIPYALAKGNYTVGDVPLGGATYTVSLGTTLLSTSYMVLISIVSASTTAINDLVYAPLVRTKTTTSFTVFLSEQSNVTQNISLDWYCIPL
jgi:hypothetical protein